MPRSSSEMPKPPPIIDCFIIISTSSSEVKDRVPFKTSGTSVELSYLLAMVNEHFASIQLVLTPGSHALYSGPEHRTSLLCTQSGEFQAIVDEDIPVTNRCNLELQVIGGFEKKVVKKDSLTQLVATQGTTPRSASRAPTVSVKSATFASKSEWEVTSGDESLVEVMPGSDGADDSNKGGNDMSVTNSTTLSKQEELGLEYLKVVKKLTVFDELYNHGPVLLHTIAGSSDEENPAHRGPDLFRRLDAVVSASLNRVLKAAFEELAEWGYAATNSRACNPADRAEFANYVAPNYDIVLNWNAVARAWLDMPPEAQKSSLASVWPGKPSAKTAFLVVSGKWMKHETKAKTKTKAK